MAMLKISLDKIGFGKVEVDGKDISGACSGIEIFAGAGKLTQAKLTVMGDIEVQFEAQTVFKLLDGNDYKVVRC